jgi:hypothetical protein
MTDRPDDNTDFGAEPHGEADDVAGMHWFNSLTEAERAYWSKLAGSARPVDAWRAYKREGGH